MTADEPRLRARYAVLRGKIAYDREGQGILGVKGEYVHRVKGTMGHEKRTETHLERISRFGAAKRLIGS